jgi:hypothetical protein
VLNASAFSGTDSHNLLDHSRDRQQPELPVVIHGAIATFASLRNCSEVLLRPNCTQISPCFDSTVEEFQTNLILPQPRTFLNPKPLPSSIIRPTETKGAAMRASQVPGGHGLFIWPVGWVFPIHARPRQECGRGPSVR